MSALVENRPSPIHGMGVFACCDLPAETRVLEYLGVKINKAESLRRCALNNEYLFYLDEHVDLDGGVDWNPARFVNHSCAPNCEARGLAGTIWIVAGRDISAGEELTFNYGYDLVDYRQHPCRCGVPACAGFMLAEEFFAHVKAMKDLAVVQFGVSREGTKEAK